MTDPHKPLPEGRLDSWKEIAVHLKRDVRTVQRWEKEEGLPVHRHAHKKLGTVFAYLPEIDAWSAKRRVPPEGSAAPDRRSASPWILAGIGSLLICVVVLAVRSAKRAESRPLVFTQVTTDTGLTWQPALSPKGDMVAYASDREGDGNLDIWVQRTFGGAPVRLTNHVADDVEPAFSPDGAKVLFRSERDGGGVYAVPVTGGEARKIADGGRRPRYSPDGKWIAYWAGNRPHLAGQVYVVSAEGGRPRSLLEPSAAVRSPVWTPDGKHLLVAGRFHGHREGELPTDVPNVDWYIVSLDGGPTVRTGALQAFEQAGLSAPGGVPWRFYPDVWLPEKNEVIFSAILGNSTNLWRISISPRTWKIGGQPQRLTSGTGLESYSSVSSGGILALSSLTSNHGIWSLPVDADRAKVTGAIQPLTRNASDDFAPSISADGKKLAFESFRTGERLVWTKDLASGREAALTDAPSGEALPRITADGSRVAFSIFPVGIAGASLAGDIYVIPFIGGQPGKVCERCGYAWGWSPDSTKLLYGTGKSMSVLDVDSGRNHTILEAPGYWFWSGRFSWDARWISFVGTIAFPRIPDTSPGPAVTRFRDGVQLSKEGWIQMTEGGHQLWSPDGTRVYSASRRDGLLCLWSSRLNPETKQPIGSPQPVHHLHRARFSLPDDPDWLGLSVARDKIVFSLRELTGNIWIATYGPAQ